MIFGSNSPAYTLDGTNWVKMDFGRAEEYKYMIPDYVEHTSVITGKKHFITKGYYAKFDVILHLSKNTDPTAVYQLLHNDIQGKIISGFKPHSDGEFIKDANGNMVSFYVSEVRPFYLESDVRIDAVFISMKSTGYVNLYKTLENIQN